MKPLYVFFSLLWKKDLPHNEELKLNFFPPKENKSNRREKLEVNSLNSHQIFYAVLRRIKTGKIFVVVEKTNIEFPKEKAQ